MPSLVNQLVKQDPHLQNGDTNRTYVKSEAV